MMGISRLLGILKPEYLFRPSQIPRRLWLEYLGRREEVKTTSLPWGLEIAANTGESIGWSIYTRALYETAVTESLWRIARVGDLVVDVGANIGYMTSILALRVGARGRVYSFEPHPGIFEVLRTNVTNWNADGRCGQIILYNAALASREGVGTLRVPDYFCRNQGTSSIEWQNIRSVGQTLAVRLLTLDDIFPRDETIGVVKLDVEGYELEVLRGMERMLRARRVRHIVFEEDGGFPAPTHAFLADMGYESYGIEQHFSGIRFARDRQPLGDPVNGPSPNYLATTVSEADVSALAAGFWQSFGPARFFT